IPQTQALVLSGSGRPCGIGEAGEIVLRTPFRSLGYLDNPEENRLRFRPNPFRNDAGDLLYLTGDRGRYRLDGSLEILGRFDEQVKVRGVRIEPAEIQAALRGHPAVWESAVVVREIRPGDHRLVAYLVLRAGAVLDPERLRRHLRQELPEAMVPSAFMVLDALPLTPNGKLDRRALPAPELMSDEAWVAPRRPIEEILAGIWAGVLGVERIGIHDDFFALGGHSLLAVQALARSRHAFGVDLPLRALFEEPTIAGLAVRIERARSRDEGRPEPPPLGPVPRDPATRLPLSFAQQRLWFLQRLEPASAQYNVPTALGLTGPLRVEALTAALGEILRRHESLRTTFGSVEGVPFQRVSPATACHLGHLPVVDLAALAPADREREAERLARAEARQPFDLERGPVLHTRLLRIGTGDHLLLSTMHHIASDGWSMGILTRELTALYRAACAGTPSPLTALPVHYADFAVWQRRWLTGEALERELSYRRERLAGAPPHLELPTDRPRPALQSFRGAQHPF